MKNSARMPDLGATLKQAFGYDSFRPLQEEIITDALAGRDVFALLPTGGGKSLCFQLPALVGNGLTVVVSPLIALMKDQDRKSTRLNSSHLGISYAVFCLKKKKKKLDIPQRNKQPRQNRTPSTKKNDD